MSFTHKNVILSLVCHSNSNLWKPESANLRHTNTDTDPIQCQPQSNVPSGTCNHCLISNNRHYWTLWAGVGNVREGETSTAEKCFWETQPDMKFLLKGIWPCWTQISPPRRKVWAHQFFHVPLYVRCIWSSSWGISWWLFPQSLPQWSSLDSSSTPRISALLVTWGNNKNVELRTWVAWGRVKGTITR